MAATVGRYPFSGGGGGFEHSAIIRRCRLRSFPHPDIFSIPSPSLSHRSRSTPCLASLAYSGEQITGVKIVGARNAPGVHALVVEAAAAMSAGARPVPTANGLGGAYMLSGSDGVCIAVIKPVEKQLAISGVSISAGETAAREVAAYLLDHGAFAGVPPTALIQISHPAFYCEFPPSSGIASIQRFSPHESDAGNLGPSKFSVSSVHRIGILDIRLLNTDRHAGNLLVQKQRSDKSGTSDTRAELVPIDHGLCLPEILEDPYFEWLHWPQASVPFSRVEKDYVSKLDPFTDGELLRAELPSLPETAIRILILCTTFLKKAVYAGLCLSDIGGMMTREFRSHEAGESILDALCKKTEETMAAEALLSEREQNCEDLDYVTSNHLLLRSGRMRSLNFSKEEEAGENKMKNLSKSMSFPTAGDMNSAAGKGQRIDYVSLMNKSEEEWMLFLERFERVLNEAFKERKKIDTNCKLKKGYNCKLEAEVPHVAPWQWT